MKRHALIAAAALCLFVAPSGAQQPQQAPADSTYIMQRVGEDALSIAGLLRRLQEAQAKNAELKAELDKARTAPPAKPEP